MAINFFWSPGRWLHKGVRPRRVGFPVGILTQKIPRGVWAELCALPRDQTPWRWV